MVRSLSVLALIVFLSGGCGGDGSEQTPREVRTGASPKMNFWMSSPVMEYGEEIPARHTCDGPDLSPALIWENVPAGARSLALISEDPDAPGGTWVHWVIYRLPPDATGLDAGVPTQPVLESGARQGLNDFGSTGYRGPCPPPGKAHRYFFRLYALDVEPELAPGASRAQLVRAMEGHVVGKAQLMGTYKR
jgi:hypothetical protein